MRIHNVRLGFATNSSSCHSVVLVPGGRPEDGPAGDRFGDEGWIAGTRRAKRAWLAIAIREALDLAGLARDAADAVVRALAYPASRDGYIDHQSLPDLPLSRGGGAVDRAFVADLAAFLDRSEVVIRGEYDPPGAPALSALPRDSGHRWVCRKDAGGWWVLFDERAGTKIRLSFAPGADGNAVTAAKSDVPELVDLKITDACPSGCAWCYQASTPGGRHADPAVVYNVLRHLGDLGTFEVALGGGEPTLHPQFDVIAREARRFGIVPNFSTRNMDWFDDADRVRRTLEVVGGIAFSAHAPDEIDRLAARLTAAGIEPKTYPPSRVSLQHVVGTGDLDAVLARAHARHFRLTLLGLKTDGRGASWLAGRSVPDWTETAIRARRRDRCPELGIDTALAADAEGLDRLGIHPVLYDAFEGKHSCYIDAVAGTMAPASHGCADRTVPLPGGPGGIKEMFARW